LPKGKAVVEAGWDGFGGEFGCEHGGAGGSVGDFWRMSAQYHWG